MKTKEIEVWVKPSQINKKLEGLFSVIECTVKSLDATEAKLNGEEAFKARLIIDLPEKKVEISESQFDEILKDARSQYRDTSDCIWHLKQKLFGKEEK